MPKQRIEGMTVTAVSRLAEIVDHLPEAG